MHGSIGGRSGKLRAVVDLRRLVMRAALVALLLAGAGGARAGDLVWRVLEGKADHLEAQANRLAQEGFTAQALVAGAPSPMLLVARSGWHATRQAAEYRLVGSPDDARLGDLGAQGFRLRDAASSHESVPAALFARALDGGPAPVCDYRAVSLAAPDRLADALAGAAGEGFRVVAGFRASLSRPEWAVLERCDRAPREVRVVLAESAPQLEEGLNRLASEGYACDTAWSRNTNKLGFGGPRRLVGVASRVAGSPTPVAHVEVEVDESPSASGELVAATAFGGRFVFVIRHGRGRDYSTHDQRFAESGQGAAWINTADLQLRLNQYLWRPIASAWMVYEGTVPVRLVAVERSEPLTSVPTPIARAEVAALVVPADATALPAGGGDPGRDFLAQLEATRRNDLKAAKALWTGPKLARWNEHVKDFKAPFGLGFSEKTLFEAEARDAPTDPVVVGGWARGTEAVVRVEATVDGGRAVADHALRLEGGRWKLAEPGRWRPLGP